MKARTVALAVLLAVPALVVACNGILGIDAPILASDGGTDAATRPDRIVTTDSKAMTDAGHDARRPGDTGVGDAHDGSAPRPDGAAPDAGRDAPPAFTGTCSCPSLPDGGCAPVLLASNQANPTAIAADPDAGVFWVNYAQDGGSVWARGLTAAATPAPVSQSEELASGIGYGHGFVYWTDTVVGLRRGALPHGPAATVDTVFAAEGLALGATKAFVASDTFGQIAEYNLLDGGQSLLTSAAGSAPDKVGVDAVNVYWSASGAVYGCPQTGCGFFPTVYGRSGGPNGVASNGTTLFWADSSAGAVYSVPVNPVGGTADGGATTLLFTAASPSRVAADDSHVYVVAGSQILRANLDGTHLVAIANGVSPSDLALAGSCVYWLDDTPGTGRVYASAK